MIHLQSFCPILSSRLVSPAHFATDIYSVLAYKDTHFPDFAMGSPPPGWSALSLGQPLIIEQKGVTNSSGFVAGEACTKKFADVATFNHRADMWRSCMAGSVPTVLVDMRLGLDTMVPFGSNNMLALMSSTMVITVMLSLAVLPNIFFSSDSDEVWGSWMVFASCLLLFGHFIAIAATPFTQPLMYLPTNNAVIILVLDVVAIMGTLTMARRRHVDNAVEVEAEVVPMPPAPSLIEPENENKLAYLGKHSTSGGSLWGRTHNGKVVQAVRFVGSNHHGHRHRHDHGPNKHTHHQSVRLLEAGGNHSVDDVGKLVRLHPTKVLHTDNLVVALKDGTVAMVGKNLLNGAFVDDMYKDGTITIAKYFEYSMTAGLFLVATTTALGTSSDAYTYQLAYAGMFLCNVVAIPITNALKDGYKVPSDDKIMVAMGIISVLIASCVFFVAAMLPLLMQVAPIIFNVANIPIGVKWLVGLVLGFYCLFAVAGTVGILESLYKGMSSNATHGPAVSISKNLVITYEVLNLCKFAISAFVLATVINSIGLM